jgi:hypothetical protein
MSNIRKRMIAIAVVASMALAVITGCSNNSVGKGGSVSSNNSASSESSSSESTTEEDGTISSDMLVTPFQTGSADDIAITDPNAPTDANSDTTTAKDNKTTTAAATVTDASGKTVTAAASEKSTDAYVATAANNGNSNNNNNNDNNTSNSDSNDYKSSTDSMYCLWIDISKDENYVFNDKFIKITFKIKEGIPNKDYPIRFNPDFSSISGVSVHPDKVSQGTIRVGSGDIEAMDVSSENGFVAYGDNIACKQGDTIDYYINLKNNPGLAAILVWFYYDKNAMEVVSVKPVGEFAEAAQNGETQVGTRPNE